MDEDLTGDPLDDALRRSLAGPGVGAGPTTDRAWAELAPRLRRARRRHRAAIVGGALVVVLGVSAAAIATGPLEHRGQVIVPAGRPHRSTTTTAPDTTSTTAPTSTTSTTSGAADSGVVPSVPNGGPVVGDGSGADPAATSTTTATPPPVPPDETRTYTAPGGRATVRVAGGVLTLVEQVASPGYTAEVTKTDPEEVEVVFHPERGRDSSIRVRVEDGVVTAETE